MTSQPDSTPTWCMIQWLGRGSSRSTPQGTCHAHLPVAGHLRWKLVTTVPTTTQVPTTLVYKLLITLVVHLAWANDCRASRPQRAYVHIIPTKEKLYNKNTHITTGTLGFSTRSGCSIPKTRLVVLNARITKCNMEPVPPLGRPIGRFKSIASAGGLEVSMDLVHQQ